MSYRKKCLNSGKKEKKIKKNKNELNINPEKNKK